MRKCDVCGYERETEYKKIEFDYADTGSGKVWWHLCSECRKLSHATMQARQMECFMREHPWVAGIMFGSLALFILAMFAAVFVIKLVG